MKIETYHVLLQNWDILYFICNEFTTSATTRTSTTPNNNVLLSIIHKISQVSIQIVILIKFSWINRNSFQFKGETIQTENNSTLSKVAIYILQELKVIKNLINGMEKVNRTLH